MIDQPSEIDISPLEQIRQTEADVTRKIAAARKTAEQVLDEARRQAVALKREAQESGAREGQARYRALIAKAEDESQALVAEAQTQAKKLRRRGKERMQEAVGCALSFIIDLAEGANES